MDKFYRHFTPFLTMFQASLLTEASKIGHFYENTKMNYSNNSLVRMQKYLIRFY